jgi:hypothetical protein
MAFRLLTLSPCHLVALSLLITSLSRAADFTITKTPAGPELVGFGAEMNPYLYCAPNWGEVNDQNIADFERKVIDLSPQHVRVFFLQQWFDGRADDISKGDPKTAESFIRTCKLAQRAGATINVTHWRGPWPEPERQMADFAATLEELIRKRQLTAIRYVTIQNEVNYTKIPFETYNLLYRSLDAELKRRGLRDRIKIVSGDLVGENQRAWFANLGQNLADVSDGYSIHVYWDYWDTAKLVRRVSEVPPIVAALPRDQQRPLYVTEFGVRGRRTEPRIEPGTHDDGTPIANKPLQATQLAWFQMEALNRGYVATVIWTLEDAWYDRLMPYGVIGRAKDGWPTKPSYHMLRLFTHTIKPGWRAMKVTGGGDAGGCIVAAATGPREALTVLALNPTEKPATVSIALGETGIPPGRTVNVTLWNADGTGTLARAPTTKVSAAGSVRLTLNPATLTAITTDTPQIQMPDIPAR